ncbi:MAG: hypothetical protein RIT27_1995 [Pseudomonadota bacterium]|jgi:Tfp pilus assembly protein PilF
MRTFLIILGVLWSFSGNADEININPDEIAQNVIESLKKAKSGVDLDIIQNNQQILSPWLSCQSIPNSILLARGLLYYKQQQINQANQDITLYLQRNPNDLTALLIQGAIYRNLGEYDNARNICRQTERLVSKTSKTLCFAEILSRQGKMDLAYEQLRQVVFPAQQESPQAYQRLHIELATIDQRLRRFENAQENFTKALSAPFRDQVLWLAYSDFLLETMQFEKLLYEIPNDSNDVRLQVRRSIAAKKLGKTELVNSDIFIQARAQNNLSLRTDEALFLMEIQDDTQAALNILQTVWETRKEPFEAKLLIKAANLAKQPDIANSVLNWTKNKGWEDHFE